MKTFRLWLTILSAALCLFNLAGLDPDNALFYHFSLPVWVMELVGDVHLIGMGWVYLLTIATYYLLGWGLDRVLGKARVR